MHSIASRRNATNTNGGALTCTSFLFLFLLLTAASKLKLQFLARGCIFLMHCLRNGCASTTKWLLQKFEELSRGTWRGSFPLHVCRLFENSVVVMVKSLTSELNRSVSLTNLNFGRRT